MNQEETMIELVSMIGAFWGGPDKAAIEALGGVDTYRSHRTMAARVTTAR